jgi:hypothetical protein
MAMIALGGALAFPAELWGGASGRSALLAAWLLVVVPGWGVLLGQGLVKSPLQGVAFALGSTVGRLLFVGLGFLAIVRRFPVPEFQFAVWVVACYLAALAVETLLVLRSASAAAGFAPLFHLGGR